MNLIKTFVIFAAMASLSARADVQALYWQVTEASNVNGVKFTAAALGVIDGSGNISYLHNGSANGNQWVAASSVGGLSTQEAAAILDQDYSGWSFFIELQNYDANTSTWYTSGRSESYTYTQVQSHIFSPSGVLSSAPLAWTPTVNVPEPTSGVLMLLGGALLALRRRRA